MLGATNLKDFKHAFVREKNLVTKLYNYGFEMCILQSAADVDAFQSGRYAEHNGRPKTLKKVA